MYMDDKRYVTVECRNHGIILLANKSLINRDTWHITCLSLAPFTERSCSMISSTVCLVSRFARNISEASLRAVDVILLDAIIS